MSAALAYVSCVLPDPGVWEAVRDGKRLNYFEWVLDVAHEDMVVGEDCSRASPCWVLASAGPLPSACIT